MPYDNEVDTDGGNKADRVERIEREKIWLKQEGESDKYYSFFLKYLELGPTRTVVAVGPHFNMKPRTMQPVSAQHDWVRRAEAYDAYLADQRMGAVEANIIEVARFQAYVGRTITERGLQRLLEVDISKLPASVVHNFIETGIRIERQALGMGKDDDAEKNKPIEIIFTKDFKSTGSGNKKDKDTSVEVTIPEFDDKPVKNEQQPIFN